MHSSMADDLRSSGLESLLNFLPLCLSGSILSFYHDEIFCVFFSAQF